MIECVPNFSEGRDLARVNELEFAVSSAPGVLVLDRSSDPDHNRSVLTFAGDTDSVIEAAVHVAAKAAELIDLNHHRGVHPRLGALDVLPFVPLGAATLEDCVGIARRAANRIWRELGIPVYFYQAAATRPDRIKLENVRRGQFEGLREAVFKDENKRPDLGGPALHATAGAVIVGARKILIAYNINLKTTRLEIAKSIAKRIRASSGGFPSVKALGFPILSKNVVQVSMNLTDIEETPLHVVYSEVCRLAAASGIEVDSTELIGLMPRRALEAAALAGVELPRVDPQKILENRIQKLVSGIKTL